MNVYLYFVQLNFSFEGQKRVIPENNCMKYK